MVQIGIISSPGCSGFLVHPVLKSYSQVLNIQWVMGYEWDSRMYLGEGCHASCTVDF